MKEVVNNKKKLNPVYSEKIDAHQKEIKKLKLKAKAEKQKRLNDTRIELHDLVCSFVSQGWPEDYETLKSNIKSIIEE